MRRLKPFIVYDNECNFCVGIANYFKKHWKIKIIPKNKCEKYKFLRRELIEKDVHYVTFGIKMAIIYSGPEAIINMLSTKYKFLKTLYEYRIFRFLFNWCYSFIKKNRKKISRFL